VIRIGLFGATGELSLDAIEIARLYGKPVIYDTDDNWVDPPPEYHPAYVYHSGILVRNTVERYLSKADLVTVSTPALAETFSRFQDRILVVPNTVDFEPPGRFRRELLDGMKDPVPPEFEPQVRRYYQEIVR
jgi:hypothetical protein